MRGVNVNERALAAEIGKIIRRERQALGWTVEQLSIESGRDRNTMSRVESGAICSKMAVLMDLLYALDCGSSVFLEIVAADAALRMAAPALETA